MPKVAAPPHPTLADARALTSLPPERETSHFLIDEMDSSFYWVSFYSEAFDKEVNPIHR
jgi:hypothetical protein